MRLSFKASLVVIVLAAGVAADDAFPEHTCLGFRKPGHIRFHLGGNYPPYDYLVDDPLPYTQVGFGVEFAQLLCEKFELECEFVRAAYDECWLGSDFPGRGVTDGTFDACSTYTDTYLRRTGVDFSHAYTKRQSAGVLSRLDEKGNPVVSPQASDLRGYKIGFIAGWATNAGSFQIAENGCTGEVFYGYKAVVPKDPHEGPDAAMRALVEGDVDALYAFSSLIDNRRGCNSKECDPSLYEHLGEKYAWVHTGMTEYQANGTTLAFTAKGSTLNEFLNPLIQEMLESKEYADLCLKYAGEDIDCFRNSHTDYTEDLVKGNLPDLRRTSLCDVESDPDKCLACSSGYCGCTAPILDDVTSDTSNEFGTDEMDEFTEEMFPLAETPQDESGK